MTPTLIVVSEPQWADQLDRLAPYWPGPLTVFSLDQFRHGIWDLPRLHKFRQLLKQHRRGHVFTLGKAAAQAVWWGQLSLGRINAQAIDDRWPWTLPNETPRLDRQTVLAELGIPADAMVFVTSSRFRYRIDSLPAIWGFEVIRYPYQHAYLVFSGVGPCYEDTREFASQLAPEGTHVRFAGTTYPLASLVELADGVVAIDPETAMAGLLHMKPMAVSMSLPLGFTDDVNALVIDPKRPPSVGRALAVMLTEPETRERLASNMVTLRAARQPAALAADLASLLANGGRRE